MILRPPHLGLVLLGVLAAARTVRADEPSASSAPADSGDVHVQGARREVGGTAMRREETRDIPGTFGDPSRVVEAMPGVVPTSSGLQAFYVRGAPPETTTYFIDGVPVPALYHVGFGPSVIHPGLLERVEFFPGAAPASFGRGIGAVLEGETTSPARVMHGEANLRAFDAGALVETPFGEGRGSALAAGRYGYPGLIVPLFAPDVRLAYWDYQTRATWDLTKRDRIGIFVFGSRDRLDEKLTNAAGQTYTSRLLATEFHRVDLRYDRALAKRATLRIAATLGADLSGNDAGTMKATSARVRAELDTRVSASLRVRAGMDTVASRYLQDTTVPSQFGISRVSPNRHDAAWGMYGDVAWRVARPVEIAAGVRTDVFATQVEDARTAVPRRTPTVDPRLATRVYVAPGVTAISTIGLAHQAPGLATFAPDATPYLNAPGAELDVSTSAQLSQGLVFGLPAGFSLSSTAFLHHYAGLPDLTASCLPSDGGSVCAAQRVEGRAYGVELLVRRKLTESFGVMASYTLSRSERQAHYARDAADLTLSGLAWVPSEYDRTHVISAIGSYDLGLNWRVGARVYGYSGRPYSHTYLWRPAPPLNTERLPGFWRLDFRLEKSWHVGENGRVTFTVEGLNVTLNQEATRAECGPPGMSVPTAPVRTVGPALPPGRTYDMCTMHMLGPITIPSIGVEGAF